MYLAYRASFSIYPTFLYLLRFLTESAGSDSVNEEQNLRLGKRRRQASFSTPEPALKKAKFRQKRNTVIHEPKRHQLRYYEKPQQTVYISGKVLFRVTLATINGFPTIPEAQQRALKYYKFSCRELDIPEGR